MYIVYTVPLPQCTCEYLKAWVLFSYNLFYTGEICTNVSVPACTSSATDCQKIGEDNEALKAFVSQHPEVYADECKESDGKQCLYTDVTYDTCTTAKTSEFQKLHTIMTWLQAEHASIVYEKFVYIHSGRWKNLY